MFRTIVLLASIFSVAAFAPTRTSVVRSALNDATSGSFDAKSQAGVSGPFGFFDPLGLCPQSKKDFSKFREAELKHGRVAMLAFAGFVLAESGEWFT